MPLFTQVIRRLGEVAYRSNCMWETAAPAPELVALVEGPDHLAPGRALDIGCGTGTSSVYLAKNGWEVTGVDIVSRALATAQRKAADAGVGVRLLQGDVTRLNDLGTGERYDLLVDLGCYHMIPDGQRDAYAQSITGMAAPGALLLMIGMGRFGRFGLTEDDLRRRFSGWKLTRSAEIRRPAFWRRFPASCPCRLIARLPLRIWHFELQRLGSPPSADAVEGAVTGKRAATPGR
jgi:SAM-dependent methyltransferase